MSNRKGIILAGGSGSRLYPITSATSKQLLPVFDKPMVFYPLSTLMLSGITEILIITNPENVTNYKDLLGDGSQFGIKLEYLAQAKPNGIAEALILGQDFLGNSDCALILGDNIFYGSNLQEILLRSSKVSHGATIFGYRVSDPSRYGIASFDVNGRVTKIVEKPSKPETNVAVTGLYFYDNRAVNFANSLSPSNRGELEITDLNTLYLEDQSLNIELLGRGYAWLDAGTYESLLDASNFISTIQKRQGTLVSSPEEIALKNKWISLAELNELVKTYSENSYSMYLKSLLDQWS